MGNTTNMLIEQLINGFHFMIAVILMMLCFLGADFFEPLLTYINGGSNLKFSLFIFFLPIIYTLGLLVDHFVDDFLFSKWEKKIRDGRNMGDRSSRELIMLTEDENQANQLDLIRTKIRITRTTSFNYVLITVFSLIFMFVHISKENEHYYTMFLMILFGGVALSGLSYWSWRQNTKTFCKRVIEGYAMLDKKKRKELIS